MLSNIKTYFKWLWFYFLLWKRFRKYNTSVSFKIDNSTANYSFRFNLKDSPILSFWYPIEDDAIIFFHVAKKFTFINTSSNSTLPPVTTQHYLEIHTVEDGFKPSDMLEYLNNFIPNFVNNYNTIFSDDRNIMEKNIMGMIKSLNRKNKIDSIID